MLFLETFENIFCFFRSIHPISRFSNNRANDTFLGICTLKRAHAALYSLSMVGLFVLTLTLYEISLLGVVKFTKTDKSVNFEANATYAWHVT